MSLVWCDFCQETVDTDKDVEHFDDNGVCVFEADARDEAAYQEWEANREHR